MHVTVDPTDLLAGLNHARGARARPRAIELAYDDTFGDACRALQGVEPPMRLDWAGSGAGRGLPRGTRAHVVSDRSSAVGGRGAGARRSCWCRVTRKGADLAQERFAPVRRERGVGTAGRSARFASLPRKPRAARGGAGPPTPSGAHHPIA